MSAENGLEIEEGRAAIWEIDRATGQKRLFASGLRNPNGLGWEPTTGALWTVVNERDELGSDLVPDYLTSVKDGAFYGWPWSYWGRHVDARVKPPRPDLVAKSITPDYALGTHVAPLGLAFSDAAHARAFRQRRLHRRARLLEPQAPQRLQGECLCPSRMASPSGRKIDFLSGFLSADGKAYGRPVGVALDRRGDLLVADDVGNVVWRVALIGR